MPKWKKIFLITVVAILAIIAALAVWSFGIEPNRLVVNEVTLQLPGWPKTLENTKVVVISDLHVGSAFIDEEKLQEVVGIINQSNPDLVLILGDFMVQGRGMVTPEVIAKNLKSLRARYGVFAVLGNHDWWHNGIEVRHALEGAGIRVLENDAVRIEKNGQSIWLVGLADLWTRRPDVAGTLKKVTDDGPIIAMTHNPDLFPTIPSRVILTVAGHTHGGQVNLPLIGRPKIPSDYGQRYAIGHVVEDNHHLFVTPGIGTSLIPVRFRVPPEISILTIRGQ